MAESIGNLFLRIGINLSELNSDFIAAEKSVAENFARLTRESKVIKLRAEMEIAGLDPAKNAAKILEVQMQSLTQQIANQQDRVKLTTAAWLDAKNKFGEAAAQTQKLNVKVKEESATLSKLQAQLQNLNNQKINLGTEQLNAQFANIQRNIDTYISNLNQKNNIIRLRTEFETNGLDKAKDATKILEVQTRSLNQQIKNQQAILRATEKELRETTARKGKFSSETMRATAQVEREKVALQRLEQELRRVSNEQQQLIDQQKATSNIKSNNLLNGYNNIKGNISGKLNEITTAFNGISTASQSADGALTKSLEIIGSIPQPAGKAAAALLTIPLVIKGIENSMINMARPAIDTGDAAYVFSRGLQMSIADTAKFTTICKVAGIEVNEVAQNIKRLVSQYVRAGKEGNILTKTLERYGAQLEDSSGHLKNYNQIILELAQSFRKAREEGNGAAFLAAVGKNWSADMATYLEDYVANVELASKIVKNKLADPVLSHDVQGQLNAMNLQAGQLSASFSSAFLPVANELIPKMTERMGELTKVIAENKENFKFLGEAIALPVRVIGELTDGFISLSRAIDKAKEEGTAIGEIFKSLGKYRDDMSAFFQSNPIAATIAVIDPIPGTMPLALKAYEQEIKMQKIKNKRLEEEAQRHKEEMEAIQKNSFGLSKSFFDDNDLLYKSYNSANEEKIKNQQETSKILFDISHNEYEKKRRDLDQWTKEQVDKEAALRNELIAIQGATAEQKAQINKESAERTQAILEREAAERKRIEKEAADKINDIREEIASKNRTDLENQIAAIEKNQKRWEEAGLPHIEAEKAAQEQKLKAIEDLEKSFAEARDAIHQTEFEKRLAQIEKEKEAWIQKGIDEVRATELAEQQKAEAGRNAAMNVLKTQLKDFRAFRDGGYEALQQRMLAELRKAGISDLDLQINPQQLQDFLQAQKNIQDNFLPNFKDFNENINSNLNEMAENVKNVNPSLDEAKTNLSEITEPIEETKEQILNTSDKIAELPTLFDLLAESISNLINTIENLPKLNQDIEQQLTLKDLEKLGMASDSWQDLRNEMNQLNSGMNEEQYLNKILSDRTNDLISSLAQEMATVSRSNDSLSQVKTALDKVADIKVSTPTVNITQHVNEPHAWDNALIQELADKVADKMKNEIIYAIKGSYNY